MLRAAVRQARRGLNGLLLVACLGATAGATNAWLCLSRIPEPVHHNPDFDWLLVPGGALHGAILAVIPVASVMVVAAWRPIWKFLLAIPMGWVTGYMSWIPLHRWALDEPWRKSLLWPFQADPGLAVAWVPFAYFGVVPVLLFLMLCVYGARRSWGVQAACATCAGVFGALWFWIEFQPWYFAVIHGTIWGLLVGAGVHRANRSIRPRELGVA